MRILVLHASAGAGHRRAAEALVKSFHAEGAMDVQVKDVLEFTPALFKQTYAKGYLDVVKQVPELWGYMYSRMDKKARIPWRRKVRSIFNQMNTGEFARFYEKYDPDVVVCTHFMPLEILSNRSSKAKRPVRLFCVVTDFVVHSLWIVENVDCYYVATDEERRLLIRRGQAEAGVEVTGIPVDPVFGRRMAKAEARAMLDIDVEMPTVLLLSGGFGVGPAIELIQSCVSTDVGCQVLVVAGSNGELESEARALASDSKTPIKVYGFVKNIHEMMDASDLVVSKPGGLTTSELLAKGIPMVIVDPIPGQEQRNCEYILENGAGVRLYDAEDAPARIGAVMRDPERMACMCDNALRLGRPDAGRDIVRDILERASR